MGAPLPRPGPGEIVCVLMERDRLPGWLDEAMPERALPDDDRRRAAAIRHAGKRAAFLSGRRLLRTLLEVATGRPGPGLNLVADANGRLELTGDLRRAVRFNLTHGRRHDAAVVALGVEVGVDVEEFAPPDRDGVAETVLSAAELAAYRALPATGRDAAFLRAWTRKEAVLKAAGVGFLVEPRGFAVGVDDTPLVVPAGAGGLPGGPWFITDVPGGVPAAVAVEGEGRRSRFIRV